MDQISVGEPVDLFNPSSMSFSERQSQLDAEKKLKRKDNNVSNAALLVDGLSLITSIRRN